MVYNDKGIDKRMSLRNKLRGVRRHYTQDLAKGDDITKTYPTMQSLINAVEEEHRYWVRHDFDEFLAMIWAEDD